MDCMVTLTACLTGPRSRNPNIGRPIQAPLRCAFVLLALVPAYQAVDPRQSALVASLGHGRWVYVWRVKWPLLQRAIASAANARKCAALQRAKRAAVEKSYVC